MGTPPGSSGTPITSGSSGALGAAESSGVADALDKAPPPDGRSGQSAGHPVDEVGPPGGIGTDAAKFEDLGVAPPARPDGEQAERLTRE
jgi:hypothetical protein